jgi:hypothetical protein
VHTCFFSYGAKVCLEQTRERLGLGPCSAYTTVGARNSCEAALRSTALALFECFDEVVFTVTLVAAGALHERVREDLHVTGCFPHLAGKNDRRVQADDVVAALNHEVPPLLLDVLFEGNTQGAVVPCRTGSAIDLTGLENKAAVLS